MTFLEDLIRILQDFLESLFSSSSPEYRKKTELRHIQADLRAITPPIWRADGALLPAFPTAILQVNAFLAYVREILDATVSAQDKRAAERFRELLFEAELPPEQGVARDHLTLAFRTQELAESKDVPERVVEDQGKRLAQYLKQLEGPQGKQAESKVLAVLALADFSHFNFNEFFSYFDPAFSSHIGQGTTVENPSFKTVEVAEIIPSLLDLYYLMTDLRIGESLALSVATLDALRKKTGLSEELRAKSSRLFQAIGYLLEKRIPAATLLSIIRVAKDDPAYVPDHPQEKADFLEHYRARLTESFDGDSRKLLKDRQNSETRQRLREVFGEAELSELEGYNDSTNALVQEFTSLSLDWIEPLRILRTFTDRFFIPHFATIVRSVVVEGYFHNRTLQSTMSATYYYCELLPSKFSEFERLFAEGEPCSLKILTGYITELEKGMDFETPLRKMIENMNGFAKGLLQQTVMEYLELYKFCLMIVEDSKKSVPEVITNIRTLVTSVKNHDSFRALEQEIGVFRNFLEIMKKYAIVGSLTVPMRAGEQAENSK